jgi:hypothetical protein
MQRHPRGKGARCTDQAHDGLESTALANRQGQGIYLLKVHLPSRCGEQSPLSVPMTTALVLKSRVRRESHARFGSGGGAVARPTDHNIGRASRGVAGGWVQTPG